MRILFSRSGGSTISALLSPLLQGLQRPVVAAAKFLFRQQSVMTAVESQSSLHHHLLCLPRRACSGRRNDSVVVVMGATGTGKSKLSIDLATRFPSEVVNSDKIQVYRGLDITTNKIPLADRCGVPHHLLGELDPAVGELPALKFRSLAASAIERIAARRRLPVVAGGSNSFIHALLAARHDPLVDPFAAGDSRRGRRERLRYRCCFLWVDVEPKVLAEYLDLRVEEMVAAGMVEELEAYFAGEGAEPGRHPGLEKAIGVPEFREYFKKARYLSPLLLRRSPAMAEPPPSVTVANAIHRIQIALLDGATSSERQLFAAGALLSRPDYEDVVVERSIADHCGYPLCPNPLPHDRPLKGRYRVSLREHKVYDLKETYKYCSPACVIASRAFAGSLSSERNSDLSASKVEQILELFHQGASLEEVLEKDGDLGLSKLTIREKADAGAGEVSLDEWMGPCDAIEGYVPQHDRNKGLKVAATQKPSKRVEAVRQGELDFTSTMIVEDKLDGFSSSSVCTQDVSEAIAKKLEDMDLLEKKTKATKTSSKSLKAKPTRKVNKSKNNQMDFKSVIVMGDEAQTSSVSTQNHSEQFDFTSPMIIDQPSKTSFVELDNNLNNEVHLENELESLEIAQKELKDRVKMEKKETALKSSLKAAGSKVGRQTVKWADMEKDKAPEERKDGPESNISTGALHGDDDGSSLRFASAEACAAALTQAAESVASGLSEAGDAVSEAGIVILPQPQHVKEGDAEADEDTFEFDRGFVKWPQKTVLLDTDMFEVEDSWHDTPPEGFSLTLSSFATMWMALFGWITCSSLAYIYGQNESSQDDFLLVNGREYPHKTVLGDGKSLEIRQTIDGFVCRALPSIVMDLKLPTPVSTLEKFVGRLLDTMSFVDALPSFRIRQWQVIVLLFLDALSVHRLPPLAPHMTNRNMLLHKVLNPAQVSAEEYESMRDLIIPLGRFPELSMQSGG